MHRESTRRLKVCERLFGQRFVKLGASILGSGDGASCDVQWNG
jgi:hypothetical protein